MWTSRGFEYPDNWVSALAVIAFVLLGLIVSVYKLARALSEAKALAAERKAYAVQADDRASKSLADEREAVVEARRSHAKSMEEEQRQWQETKAKVIREAVEEARKDFEREVRKAIEDEGALMVKEACTPCLGLGSVENTTVTIRSCEHCDGEGYVERWVDKENHLASIVKEG